MEHRKDGGRVNLQKKPLPRMAGPFSRRRRFIVLQKERVEKNDRIVSDRGGKNGTDWGEGFISDAKKDDLEA